MAVSKRTIVSKRDAFKNKLKENKLILVSVDPGFNGFKIIVNDETRYHIGSLALIDDEDGNSGGEEIAIEVKRSIGSVMYVMGATITNEILEHPSEENVAIRNSFMDMTKRFGKESFAASYIGALYAALYEYASTQNDIGLTVRELVDLRKNGYRIIQICELPDVGFENTTAALKKSLTDEIKAEVTYKGMQFKIDGGFAAEDILTETQARAPYDSLVYEAFGEYKDEESEERRKKNLPSLILISGQRTLEQHVINRAERVWRGNEDVPYADFGMERVNREVARQINEEFELTGEKAVNARTVGSVIDGTIDEIYIKNETGKRGSRAAHVKDKWDVEIERQVRELVDYVDKRFNMEELRSLYVCGGTGELYFDHIRKAFADYENIRVIELIPGYLDGDNIGALYTVAYGGYAKLAAYVGTMILD